ncbi:MAG: peroxidase-related enzyme [Bacteroidetes bacterium]|nr:peroxidase-related enzyme [Bacteroidales bacterium]MBU1010614.1 peroxidase-related enzyme [Bacteroidota bacterium]
MAKIEIIPYERSEGRLKEVYDELKQRLGRFSQVMEVQSLRPESMIKHLEMYQEIMVSSSELSRAEREMMAVVVSAANKCNFCKKSHANVLYQFWKDENKVRMLMEDFSLLALSPREKLLCEFAESLTLDPGKSGSDDMPALLRENGFSDAAILDASLVVSYFNFVNRMVLSLGVE